MKGERSVVQQLLFDNFQILFELPCPCMTDKSITDHKTNDFRIKYKTEKCRYLVEKGYCPFNQTCTFAHHDYEIRQKIHISQKYKTKICHNFNLKGFCKYGSRCHYLHVSDKPTYEEGLKTRSNSEESDCSKSSRSERNTKMWGKLTHNKRIELIQTLGFDYSIRTSSRLMQMLNSNENEEDSESWMFEEVERRNPVAAKKYSL